MFLTWNLRTNTTSKRRSRWYRSSMIRRSLAKFDLWKQSYVAACAAVYDKFQHNRRLDVVQSGCTALSIVEQGDLMVVANIGDSQVVLSTASDDDAITPSSSSST
jgi:serine/threonine protein phosphatase PrpC